MATIEPINTMGSTDRPGMTEKGQTVRHLVEADLLDERYETTKRGLKSRHVQLMALGGTIGTGTTLVLAHSNKGKFMTRVHCRIVCIIWPVPGYRGPCFIAPWVYFHLRNGLWSGDRDR